MIILLGATGMMGQKIASQLMMLDNKVWQPTRQWLMDFQEEGDHGVHHQTLQQKITPKTVVINTIGIAPSFSDQPHKAAYLAQKSVIKFCVQHNIAKIISLSALSNYPIPSEIPYLNYKYRLDDELLNGTVTSYIIRPSLIYAENGASTKFFKLLTKSPLLAFPRNPNYAVSPIDADELARFILALTELDLPSQIFEVGTQTITIQNYLKKFNPKLIILPVPEWFMKFSMQLLGFLIPAVAGKYTYQLLKVGSINQRDDFSKIMGYPATFPHVKTGKPDKGS